MAWGWMIFIWAKEENGMNSIFYLKLSIQFKTSFII